MIRRARRQRKAPERFNVCNPEASSAQGVKGGKGVKGVKAIAKKSKTAVKKNLKSPRPKAVKKITKAKKTVGPKVVKKKKTTPRPRPSKKECDLLVGQCVRINWPVVNSPEEGEYTAMVFFYNHRTKKHKLFYYATAQSEESFEEVDLFDGTRDWTPEPNPAMRHPLPGEGARSPDPRNLIGRRVWVAWPDEATGTPKSYDAVVVDYVRATEFRIVYVEDEWVENRDLVSSELAWELYDPPGDSRSDSDRCAQPNAGPGAPGPGAPGRSGLGASTSEATYTGAGILNNRGASVSAQGVAPAASASATVEAGAPAANVPADNAVQANVNVEANLPPVPLPPHLYSSGASLGIVTSGNFAISDDPPPLASIARRPPTAVPRTTTRSVFLDLSAGSNVQTPPGPGV